MASEPIGLYPAAMPDAPNVSVDLSFEAAMAELESIIEKIGSDQTGLEDAMKAHRRGQALVSRCRSVLDAVEQELQRSSGEAETAADSS